MDPMMSALKQKRGGLLNDGEENAHQMPEEKNSGGMDMKSLVGALSQDQKSQLLSLLVSGNDGGNKAHPGKAPNISDIEQGGMSPGEQSDIEESLGDGHESEDQIAESMIASSDKNRAAGGDKPRNLGERMKFGLANKLKNKGKY